MSTEKKFTVEFSLTREELYIIKLVADGKFFDITMSDIGQKYYDEFKMTNYVEKVVDLVKDHGLVCEFAHPKGHKIYMLTNTGDTIQKQL